MTVLFPAHEGTTLHDLRMYVQEELLRHPLRERLADRLLGHGGGLCAWGLHLTRALVRLHRDP